MHCALLLLSLLSHYRCQAWPLFQILAFCLFLAMVDGDSLGIYCLNFCQFFSNVIKVELYGTIPKFEEELLECFLETFAMFWHFLTALCLLFPFLISHLIKHESGKRALSQNWAILRQFHSESKILAQLSISSAHSSALDCLLFTQTPKTGQPP